MDYSSRLEISYYNTIADINKDHNIYLVQHRESGKIYIKKILEIYNPHIYAYLKDHPITGIPRIYHLYEENGKLTLIEEFISGTSLQEMIDQRALTFDLIIQFMDELCDILEKLHTLNPPVIHRDIKPSNIIITPCGHLILMDFNAAKYLNDTAEQDTILLGTKGYAAPEQYGFGVSTPQTDIYALGVLLRELSCSMKHPQNLIFEGSQIYGYLDEIIRKCTEMNPSDRIENVQKLKDEICQLKNLSIKNKPINNRPVKNNPVKNNPVKNNPVKNNPIKDIPIKNMPNAGQFSYDAPRPMWNRLIPPGFRTKTPWKMMAATIGYLFIFWLCFTMEIKDVSVPQLWVERIITLFLLLSIVFCCSDYCGIQRLIPLCSNERRPLRYLGILILNFAIIFFLLLLMMIVEAIL